MPGLLSYRQSTPAEPRSSSPPHPPRVIAFLGPFGTYTHEACLRKFAEPGFILKPYPDIRTAVYSLLPIDDNNKPFSVFKSSTPPIWATVVPIKNSTAGPVLETEQVLAEPEVARHIARSEDEIVLKIEHCLVGRKMNIDEIPSCVENRYDVVASHTQALQQCKGYLTKHYPDIRKQETSSTSQAAHLAANDRTGKTVAICSPTCASTFISLKVLDSSIQDSGIDNETTFVILQRKT